MSGDTLAIAQQRCRLLSRLTGRDGKAIWEWAVVERVANGLLLAQEGNEQAGRENLRIAEAFAEPPPAADQQQ